MQQAAFIPSVTPASLHASATLTATTTCTTTHRHFTSSSSSSSRCWTGFSLTRRPISTTAKNNTHTPRPTTCTSSSSPTQTQHPESLDTKWPAFAASMRDTGEIPGYDEWHALLHGCAAAGDAASKAVWVVNLMRDTGRTPTAATYEAALTVCAKQDDRVAAFHLVEHMYNDKVLLGDVELPDGMEDTLRAILPPDAFE